MMVTGTHRTIQLHMGRSLEELCGQLSLHIPTRIRWEVLHVEIVEHQKESSLTPVRTRSKLSFTVRCMSFAYRTCD